MKTKTNLKAGGRRLNHNQTLVQDPGKSRGIKVKTNLKAGVGPQDDLPGRKPGRR